MCCRWLEEKKEKERKKKKKKKHKKREGSRYFEGSLCGGEKREKEKEKKNRILLDRYENEDQN